MQMQLGFQRHSKNRSIETQDCANGYSRIFIHNNIDQIQRSFLSFHLPVQVACQTCATTSAWVHGRTSGSFHTD